MKTNGDSSREIEASRAHRALLANLRHELRTPLNAIIGYSEMLLEDAEAGGPGACVPDLQKIHAAGRQLLELVNRILDPAKVAAGALDIDLAALEADLRHELLTPITAAIGYTEMLLEDTGDCVAADESADMAPDLEKILAAARRFLALVGDVVHFPRIQAGETDGAAAAAAAMIQEVVSAVRPLAGEASGPDEGGRGKLLVVDDNALNRDLLARHLQREGHTVALAEDGRRALAMIQAEPFDLVLLDLIMPEMNGYEVLQHLKSDAALRDIPVIIISALDELDSVVRCLEAGAEDYLSKPFNPVVLRARIGASLEKKRLRDAEVEYLRNVAVVTDAAGRVEAGTFIPEDLTEVSERRDALGQLARVFQRMAREVYAREQRLKQQVQQLRIELDEARQAHQVAEIAESDYFQQLQATAADLRKIVDGA
jgi:CheY-like chemotaxis protein/HAMP domain-containing protein